MEFFIVGDTEKPRNVIESKIQAMGGKMASRIHANVTAVISSADEVKYDSIMIREAIIQRIQVIPDDFLNKVMDNDPIEVIVKNDLTIWGKDVRLFLSDFTFFFFFSFVQSTYICATII